MHVKIRILLNSHTLHSCCPRRGNCQLWHSETALESSSGALSFIDKWEKLQSVQSLSIYINILYTFTVMNE